MYIYLYVCHLAYAHTCVIVSACLYVHFVCVNLCGSPWVSMNHDAAGMCAKTLLRVQGLVHVCVT